MLEADCVQVDSGRPGLQLAWDVSRYEPRLILGVGLITVDRDEGLPILRSEGEVHDCMECNNVTHLLQPYEWRGLRQTKGLRSKAKRVLSQFSPHDFTALNWHAAQDFAHYVSVVLLLAVFLAAELNPFYLKVECCP
jgi:Phosphatidyl serine synthase